LLKKLNGEFFIYPEILKMSGLGSKMAAEPGQQDGSAARDGWAPKKKKACGPQKRKPFRQKMTILGSCPSSQKICFLGHLLENEWVLFG